jgi:hypothetical protein
VPASPSGRGSFERGRIFRKRKDKILVCRLRNYSYTNSVYTSQETHCVSATKTNRLMLFRAKRSLFIVRTTRNTQIHSVDRMQSFSILSRRYALVLYSNHNTLKG